MSKRRFFGKTGVSLSPITLGTMRFSNERVGPQSQAVSLLEYLYNNGIDTYHTSHEYETHPFFCDVYKKFQQQNPAIETTHIVKLASPHFEETDFSFDSLEQNVNAQLQALDIEQIDIVQWLFRQKNNVDEVRIPKLLDSMQLIDDSFNKLIQSGKVRSFACFPYSLAFAEIVNQHDLVDGFIDYLNITEHQWAAIIQNKAFEQSGFIAIRPLFAGKILQWQDEKKTLLSQFLKKTMGQTELVQWALSYPLLHPKVASSVLSISDLPQADVAIRACEDSHPLGDNNAFIDATHFIKNNYAPQLKEHL